MKKTNFYFSIGLSLTALMTVILLQSETANATQQTSTIRITTEPEQRNSVQLDLIQSEEPFHYRQDILDNNYGSSLNQSTGIFKRSSDTITIYVDEQTDQTILPTYTLSPVSLNTAKEGYSQRYQLKKGKNIINTTLEGILHLQNATPVTPKQKLPVTVTGGITLPRFILGKMTESDWLNEVKKYPTAPGYELVGTRTLITGSKDTLKYVKNPKNIVETYDKVSQSHDEISGLDDSSPLNRKSRGLVQHMRETQNPNAYMYATYGYTAYSKNAGMAKLLAANIDNLWGPMHELGHTYQMRRMTWKNQVEVTVNIYSLRSEKKLGGRSRLESQNVYTKIFDYFKQPNKNYDEQKELFLKLGMFWQLELAFGDNFYPQLHQLYRSEAKTLTSDLAKQQYLITSASKVANKNLVPYFEMWGLPVTAETKQAVQKYPKLTHKIWEYRDELKQPISPIDPNTPEKPATPMNLSTPEVKHDSVKLVWTNGQGTSPIKETIIYRDGQEIGRTANNEWLDKSVKADTAYTYTAASVSTTGELSEKSTALKVTTPAAPVVNVPAPSKPVSLSASETTQQSITLNWQASSSSIGVSSYNIYRNGVKVTTVKTTSFKDSGLQANTTYSYQVAAIDTRNQESAKSDLLTVKTKEIETQLSTWDKNKVYTAGDKVIFNNLEYEAKWWNQNNRPDQSDAWKSLSNAVMAWDARKAYNGGDKVTFQGKTYQAKWWTQGQEPGSVPVWELVK